MACVACCGEESDIRKPNPNPLIMASRFAAFGLGGAIALGGMLKDRKYKHLAAWLGAWALFLSWPRYLICARCDGYGNNCYSYYLGKYTSLVFPKVEGKDVGGLGFALEVLCLSGMFWTPVLALRGDHKTLLRYLATMEVVLLAQFFHACRWCAANSDMVWKKNCPNYRIWKKAGVNSSHSTSCLQS